MGLTQLRVGAFGFVGSHIEPAADLVPTTALLAGSSDKGAHGLGRDAGKLVSEPDHTKVAQVGNSVLWRRPG
jgi:hypothetical protein